MEPYSDLVLFRLDVVYGEAEVVEFAGVIVAEIGPFVVGTSDGLQRKMRFVLVEKSLYEYVASAFFRLIEDELYVATHWENLVVQPSLSGQLLEVGHLLSTVVHLQEAGQRHDAYLVTIAKGGTRVLLPNVCISLFQHLGK